MVDPATLGAWATVLANLVTVLYTLFSFVTNGRVRRAVRGGLGIDGIEDQLDAVGEKQSQMYDRVEETQADVAEVEQAIIALSIAVEQSDDPDQDVTLSLDAFADEFGDEDVSVTDFMDDRDYYTGDGLHGSDD